MPYESINIIDEIELFSGIVALRDDGIFQVDLKMIDRGVSLKDFRELTEAIGIIGKGAKYPVLLIVRDLYKISKEAIEYSASEIGSRYTLANAFILKSDAISIGSNNFIDIFDPVRPTKMFSSEDQAIQWLRTLISK